MDVNRSFYTYHTRYDLCKRKVWELVGLVDVEKLVNGGQAVQEGWAMMEALKVAISSWLTSGNAHPSALMEEASKLGQACLRLGGRLCGRLLIEGATTTTATTTTATTTTATALVSHLQDSIANAYVRSLCVALQYNIQDTITFEREGPPEVSE